MREATFLKKNAKKWESFEEALHRKEKDPNQLADIFIEVTDDLSYAKTNYPRSKTSYYLNYLSIQYHQLIYRNKREKGSRFIKFWAFELPFLMQSAHKQLLYAFLFFIVAVMIGAVSAAHDETFIRVILGDRYVNMTLENIREGDPMAVYKQANEVDMFLGITFNNVRVSFNTFAAGLILSFGTIYFLFVNGVMLGAFQYFFQDEGLLMTSALTIWIHGTLEISAIIIAGCAGLVMGNSILFPGTYSRLESFKIGATKGMKIIIGLIPVFITAGFLEGFVTRHTEMPIFLKLFIILGSTVFIVWYFVLYPIQLSQKNRKT